MSAGRCDIAIVGGGLSGGLIAAAFARARPDLSLRLIEAGARLGGNHRWSWFESDLDESGARLMELFPHARWDQGYEVRFPAFSRKLSTGYRSLASSDFDSSLRHLLPAEAVICGRGVIALDAGGAILCTGERIEAGTVIDCRGPAASPHLSGGWQVFYGRHLRTLQPHGVDRPIIMDAMVRQHGGYRFVYLLPLAPDELFVEDTYYTDSPQLDLPDLKERVDRYCDRHGYSGEIVGEESGVLPVITGGDFDLFQADQRIERVVCAGTRAGFAHPLTGYSVPLNVQVALDLARSRDLSGPALAARLAGWAREHWEQTSYYRMLAAMLFSAKPEERYRVFEHFYRVPEDVIERFYAGQSTSRDKARILWGKPPVPVRKALMTLASRALS